MTPFEILLWVLAGALALIIAALAVAVVILIIRAAAHAPLGKQDHDA